MPEGRPRVTNDPSVLGSAETAIAAKPSQDWPYRTGDADLEGSATRPRPTADQLKRLQTGPGVTRLPPASGSLPLPPGLSNKYSLPNCPPQTLTWQ